MNGLGERIKYLRLKNNLTQTQLAEKLNLTKSVISAYETGQRLPSYDVLIQLTKTFLVSTDYLFGIEKTKNLDLSGLSPEQKKALFILIDTIKNQKAGY